MKILKRNALLVFPVLAILLAVSCSESDIESSESSANIELRKLHGDPEGPDECNQDEYEDECEEEEEELTPSTDQEKSYAVRDNFLKLHSKGLEYIDKYYYTSQVKKDYSKLNLESLYEITDLVPYIYSAYDKMQDSNYSGVIVDTNMKNRLIKVLGAYKILSNDLKYQEIIDGLIVDATTVENKNKSEVILFMDNK